MADKTYSVITQRTYNEWPDDHPGRRLPIMPSDHLNMADVVVCSIKGEPRIPPEPPDQDLDGVCHKCGSAVVYRASAPDLPRECWKCYIKEQGGA